jgi:hypothetical protein
MRRTGFFLVAFAAAGLATLVGLTPSEARPRFGPRAVFGILGAPFGMFRRVIRPRLHRPHAARSRALAHAARRGGAALALAAPAMWAGSAFWPHGFHDLAGYAIGDGDAGPRFWSGGFADVLAGLTTPPARDRSVADVRAETTGAAPTRRASACVSAHTDLAAALARRIEERVDPKPGQEAAFAAVRTRLATIADDLRQSCPDAADAPDNAPARLAAMRERLWAIQSAALALREPFADLYAVLDADQKQRLDAVAEPAAKPSRRRGMPAIAAQICHMQAEAASARAAARIRDAVALAPEQEPPFKTLTETSAGMAKLAVASCPAAPPATALARFDAVLDRLDALLYAIVVVTTPLDVFYGSLTDEQKARFDALGGGAES